MASTKKARVGELDEHRQARRKAADEGVDLVARMRADLTAIAAFLAEEDTTIAKRGLSTKRLARLRLMAEDLGSAARFASKSIKG